jgi:hypothetical protein
VATTWLYNNGSFDELRFAIPANVNQASFQILNPNNPADGNTDNDGDGLISREFLEWSGSLVPFDQHARRIRVLIMKQPLFILSFLCLACAAVSAKPGESWAYLDNGTLRIGVDQSRGAAIGYFALSKDQRNLLNHHDEGRFIQQSYYGNKDDSMWAKKPWSYNPVQGGSYKGEDSKTLEFRKTERELYAKIEPLHWANAKTCPEAIMQEWITLDGPLAKVRMRMDFTGETQEKAAHQEMPAMFVDFDLPHLIFEKEGKLVRHQPVFLGEKQGPQKISYDTGWLAYVDDKDFGIGIYTPGTKDAVNYRHRGNGSTGPTGSACSYVAPIRTIKLTKGEAVDYEFYLTIGTLEEIRARFAKLGAKP